MSHVPLPAFAAWSGPRDARIVCVGEAWGQSEAELGGRPLAGESGKEFWMMLGEAWPDIWPEEHQRVAELHRYGLAWTKHREKWMEAASVAFTNVFALRPYDNKLRHICVSKSALPASYNLPPLEKGLYLDPQFEPELWRLEEELVACKPNLVIALGNTACWALLRTQAISSIRGTTTLATMRPLDLDLKVLPTYHPAGVLRQWSWRPIVLCDLMKALRESSSQQISRPRRRILFDPTLDETRAWVEETLKMRPQWLANDLETSLGLIDTIGFARAPDDCFVCQIGPHRQKRGQRFVTIWPKRDNVEVASYWTESEEVLFWELMQRLLESSIPKVYQNGLYDLQYLLRAGMRPRALLEDTMLASHALFPEMQKGLGFLGSIWTNEPAWKLMRRRAADTEKRDD